MTEEMNKRTRFSGALVFVAFIALAWMALGTLDWWMRFRWFRWQDTWIIRPETRVVESGRVAYAVTNPVTRGGDITHLIGIPAVAARYEEERPSTVIWTDEYGYRNYPPVTGRDYAIVVVGDSYMQNGRTMDESFSRLLEEVSGISVYCHALEGVGSFLGIIKYLEADRFKEKPPRILIWGLIEREISGVYFEGLVYQLYSMSRPKTALRNRASVNGWAFHPRTLKASLPNTSVISQFSSKVWNLVRYRIFGRIAPYVIPIDQPIGGRQVLFYYPSIDAMTWSASRRDVARVAKAVKYLDDECRRRNIRLVILLIPDKEQVYLEHIPSRFNTKDKPIQPSCLIPLEQELAAYGIPVINLLGPYREEAVRDELLYWADDTHWNTAGIRLAAQRTWDVLKNRNLP